MSPNDNLIVLHAKRALAHHGGVETALREASSLLDSSLEKQSIRQIEVDNGVQPLLATQASSADYALMRKTEIQIILSTSSSEDPCSGT